jgi:NAD-dependent dihydropyrimidine dehydrogenase PreA subunit
MMRNVITIDEEKCTGCGECIPNCPEGALQIIDGKARLISDLFCDGLGACIGHCPEDAISVGKREAEPYDERRVMENVVKGGENVVKAHLEHLRDHGQHEYLSQAIGFLRERGMDVPMERPAAACASGHNHPGGGCPGARVMEIEGEEESHDVGRGVSRLRQWPVQITLVPPTAPYLQNADLLVAADCVPFALANFHEDLLKGKVLLVGCPKLDDAEFYRRKLTEILRANDVRTITVAHMEVPCCSGLVSILRDSIRDAGKDIPLDEVTITIKGETLAPTRVEV